VVLVTQYFEPEVGAPQVRLSAFVRELTSQGIEVEVVTALPNHPEGRIHPAYRRRLMISEQRQGAVVRRVWMFGATGAGWRRMLSYISFTATSLAGLARCRRPDVVLVETPPPFPFLPARIAAVIWRCPVVVNVADLWPDSAVTLGLLHDGLLLRALYRFERWVNGSAANVIAVTQGIRNVLIDEKGVPPGKVSFLPNGVDTDLFRPDEPDRVAAQRFTPNGEQLVVFAGTVGLAQGVEVAIDAMAIVAERHPSARLLIVGAGSGLPVVERRLRDLSLSNVELLRPVSLDEVAKLYSVAFAGLATLRDSPVFEGARPSKIFPILASGKPVLYSGAGEGARLVESNRVGVVCRPEDPRALAEAIEELLADTEEAAAMGKRGRALVEEHFAWSALVGAWTTQMGWNQPEANSAH
jgi:glycosyltransferase involved in cell wall biosynthesis